MSSRTRPTDVEPTEIAAGPNRSWTGEADEDEAPPEASHPSRRWRGSIPEAGSGGTEPYRRVGAGRAVVPRRSRRARRSGTWSRCTSGREESIKAAIERKVKIEGLEEFFGQIVIPVERVTEVKKVKVTRKKNGEKVTKEKRVIKENGRSSPATCSPRSSSTIDILYLFRETSGVGDFVGATTAPRPEPDDRPRSAAMLHRRTEVPER